MLNFYELLKAGVPIDDINDMIEDEMNAAQAQIDAEEAKLQEEMKRESMMGDAYEYAVEAVVDYCNLVLPKSILEEVNIVEIVAAAINGVVDTLKLWNNVTVTVNGKTVNIFDM